MDTDTYRRTPVPRIVADPRARRRTLLVRGGPTDEWRDVYHHFLTLSWPAFIVLVAAAYLALNLLFAGLYFLDLDGLANAHPGSFGDAFNFSVETLATIGYGALSPRDGFTNTLVTVEAFTGIFLTAALTGLIFSRIARPTARVMFSRIALVTDFEGRRALMLRAANQRANQILEAQASLTLARQVVTAEGVGIRRFVPMRLQRDTSPLFALTWTLIHEIDGDSPLAGQDEAALRDMQAELIVIVSGVDETFAQRVHARTSYVVDELMWNRHFEDVLYPHESGDGRWVVDYTRFHDVKPAAPAAAPQDRP